MALTNTDPPLDFCYLTRAPWRAQQTQLHITEELRFRLPSDGHLTPIYPTSPLFSDMHQYSSTMRQPVSIFMVGIGLRAQLAHQSSWIPRVLIQARPRAVAAHASHMRTHYQPVFSTPISSAQYECRDVLWTDTMKVHNSNPSKQPISSAQYECRDVLWTGTMLVHNRQLLASFLHSILLVSR